ncbi:uncharacterized protein LAESUDRAFT_130824 [Laetiporus sulphureus 93-53]|uniref:Uncharacterized protein n=1 Tax=Laetiporus sulphureus 93-53 TaxID=1314785 RepID=A0A165EHL3_9APHY|nr:uncharacterized protein LAESUDRAFT_130824 [Laetiporus sulphureus 93-53]KZT07066.1 hypothetical protein LAESUDRAFT_130824 [Laetiporus sulphureus 93-53]
MCWDIVLNCALNAKSRVRSSQSPHEPPRPASGNHPSKGRGVVSAGRPPPPCIRAFSSGACCLAAHCHARATGAKDLCDDALPRLSRTLTESAHRPSILSHSDELFFRVDSRSSICAKAFLNHEMEFSLSVNSIPGAFRSAWLFTFCAKSGPCS